MGRILVAYETKSGGTREVAEEVARVLRDDGLEPQLADVRERTPDLGGYDGYVLGAPVRAGRWSPKMTRFVKKGTRAMHGKPVAVFAIGGSFGKPDEKTAADPEKLAEHEKYAGKCEASARERSSAAEPCLFARFPGVIRPEAYGAFVRKMMEKAEVPTEDPRDWDAIRSWAHEVAGAMPH